MSAFSKAAMCFVFIVAVSMLTSGNAVAIGHANDIPTAESSALMDANRNRIFDNLESQLNDSPDDEPIDVIVTMTPTAPPDYLARLRDSLGPFETSYVYDVISGFSGGLTKSQVLLLSAIPWVRQVEADSKVHATMDSASRWFGVQKARADFGVDGDRDGSPRAFAATDIVIAILDTGVDASHVDLDGGKVIGWHDFVGTRTTPYDDNGHGTHVSSIAAGTGEGDSRYIGVAPGAALVVGKVLDSSGTGATNTIVAGVNWVVNNRVAFAIRILSMSLVSPICSDGTDALSQSVNGAWAAGVVVTVAAGNSGPNTCTIGTPAAATGAITVGAMADPGAGGFYLAYFSSRGPTLDGRTKPDITGPGVGVTAAKAGSGNLYVSKDGTSMATPFVAGTVALMLTAKPSLTPNQVRTDLAFEDWGPDFADNDYGRGRLDGYESVRYEKGVGGSPPGVPWHTSFPNYHVGNGGTWSYTVPMSDLATPIAATLLEEKTCIGLEIWFNGQRISSSHGTNRQDTAGGSVGTRGMYEIRVMDDSWFRDCGSSFTLDLSYRNDDWGSFRYAGETFDSALPVSTSSGTGGFLEPGALDRYDWYQVYVYSGYTIDISMTPLQGVNYDLQLVDPSRTVKATSSRAAGLTEWISFKADSSGYWRFVVYAVNWETGVYAITLGLTWYGGCVARDTPILTDGGYVPVQKLRPGDTVIGYDLSSGNLTQLHLVSNNMSWVPSVVSINNGALVVTPTDQPLFVKNDTFTGWLRDPRNLTVGDYMFDPVNGRWVQVTSMVTLDTDTRVYNVVTDGWKDFIANGFLLLDK